MGWIYRDLDKQPLRTYLRTHTNVEAARQYGVRHSTIATWRRQLDLPPFTQGAGKPSRVATALLRGMHPGRWYAFGVLHMMAGHTRQQVYALLGRLTQQGQLVRRGQPGAYVWQRGPGA